MLSAGFLECLQGILKVPVIVSVLMPADISDSQSQTAV